MREARRMYRCEVASLRAPLRWIVLDECPHPTTTRAYKKAMRKAYPILASRTWRIVPSEHRAARTLFRMTVPLN